jgi:hypothetical protein
MQCRVHNSCYTIITGETDIVKHKKLFNTVGVASNLSHRKIKELCRRSLMQQGNTIRLKNVWGLHRQMNRQRRYTDRQQGDLINLISFSKYGKKTPCPESASELCRSSGRRLSAKLVPTFAYRRCRVASVTDPYYGRIVVF